MEPKKAFRSSVLNFGKKTYFFDVRESSNDKKYLKVTESRMVEAGMPEKRNFVVLFPDEIQRFISALAESDNWIKENTF